ncbi:MAG TPA: hypothetical protein PLM61_15110 [Thermoanaerobaculales bacterium]|nr:hypothetical protein [Thermoanaerobaculales bacterium]
MPDTPTITEAPAVSTEPDPTTETFTQADVDRIVRERVQRERAKYADYDALKAKAEGAKTVEDRLAEMEKRTAAAEASALRSDVAARHGISAEDRDLLLTGTDAETLEAQAKRIAEASERKKKANIVPREGNNPKATGGDEEREFVRKLFGRATAE